MSFFFKLLRPVVAVGLVSAVLVGCGKSAGDQSGAQEQAPVEVGVVELTSRSAALTTELPGRAVAFRRAEVRPQVNGIVQQRLFEEGAEVAAGQRLYQIEPDRYRASVATAQAGLARARANLTSAQARQSRYQGLLGDKAISEQEYEDALATFQLAEADVAVSEAQLQSAQIDLDHAAIRAPIGGRIGKSSVTEGALVGAQQGAHLATINQLDPIYVDMSQSAQDVLALRRQLLDGSLSRNQSVEVRAILEDGSQYPHVGELQFSEVSVNGSTGTVVMRAVFPNPDHLLLPGMFVRAEVTEAVKDDAILVPQRGVTHNREGRAVTMIVNDQNEVEERVITTGRTVGSDWLVMSGLNAGDRVIVEGLQKVAPGASVAPVAIQSVARVNEE